MNKERYNEIIDEVYTKYRTYIEQQRSIQKEEVAELRSRGRWVSLKRIILLSKEEFINKIKTDRGFSDKWGLKIEERELDLERRYNIWFNNNVESGMERHFDPNKLPNFDDPYWEPTPTREVLVTYKDEQIKFYE